MPEDESENIYEYQKNHQLRHFTRRGFFGAAGGAAVGAAAVATGLHLGENTAPTVGGSYRNALEPFYGIHQGGVTTTPQSHTYFASLNFDTENKHDVIDLLRTWTTAAANLAVGETVDPLTTKTDQVEPDSGEAMGLGAERLTVNFGFGPSLFADHRFGVSSKRPAALVDLPRFPGDQLIATKVGGDVTIHACADDPQVAFHAVRQLVRLANGVASIVWTQAGFNEVPVSSGVPRNLMGFKDGIVNPSGAQLNEFVWVGPEGPKWMRGGTYLVARRIRISLEHWDSKSLGVQEQVIGRYKVSGAPLGESSEFAPLNLSAKDNQGNPLIPSDSHVRLTAPAMNHGQMILRRSYAYNDGVDPFIERWPPWQQALMYDAGLLFCAYQRDPRKGFIPINKVLAENDSLSQFTTHTGSTIVAIPAGVSGPGHFVGEGLFV